MSEREGWPWWGPPLLVALLVVCLLALVAGAACALWLLWAVGAARRWW